MKGGGEIAGRDNNNLTLLSGSVMTNDSVRPRGSRKEVEAEKERERASLLTQQRSSCPSLPVLTHPLTHPIAPPCDKNRSLERKISLYCIFNYV